MSNKTLTTSILMISAYICMYSVVIAQEMNYTKKYCLDFTFQKPYIEEWRLFSTGQVNLGHWMDRKNNIEALKIESQTYMIPATMFNSTEAGANASNSVDFKYRERLEARASFWEKILLPSGNFNNGLIALTCKGENLKQADFIIIGYDMYENIVSIDTLHALSKTRSSAWQTFRKNIPLENTVFLSFVVATQGIDSSYHHFNGRFSYNAFGHADSTCTQYFLMDKIEIFLDGTPIDSFPLNEHILPLSINPSDVIPLSFEDERLYAGIPELKTKKIIAIGESFHGSETMAKTAVQLIKHQVKNNNCKLVVLEAGGEEMLIFNRFVQGDPSISLDKVNEFLKFWLVSPEQLKDLFLWLKNYNATTDKKVWLLGMDYDWTVYHRKIALAEYLLTINNGLNLHFINEICRDLLDREKFTGQQNPEVIYDLWLKNKYYLYSHLDLREIELIEYFLSKLPSHSLFEGTGDKREIIKRDSIMSDNLHFFSDLICSRNEKIVIYSHFLHANYIDDNLSLIPSFGHNAKKNFNDNYYHIGLFAAQGACSQPELINLAPPIENSLEFSLNKIDTDYFYLSTSKMKEELASIRIIVSTTQNNQFQGGYLSPIGRMGGIIFIKNSEPFSFQASKVLYESRMDECIRRLNEFSN